MSLLFCKILFGNSIFNAKNCFLFLANQKAIFEAVINHSNPERIYDYFLNVTKGFAGIYGAAVVSIVFIVKQFEFPKFHSKRVTEITPEST